MIVKYVIYFNQFHHNNALLTNSELDIVLGWFNLHDHINRRLLIT